MKNHEPNNTTVALVLWIASVAGMTSLIFYILNEVAERW